ncbi:uncharacterized protein [Drosophila pseudoobscura]|nr:uncharacterized protein LOC26532726 isoform X2 [Drosophila pseudoobscura]
MTISHKTLCKALMEARLRGVQVRIATPKKMLSARDLVTRQLLMYIHSVDHSEVPIIKCVFLDGNRIILRMDDELLLLMRRLLIDENLFSYYFWYFGYLWHGEYFEPLDIPTAA